jgi:hypothetical protein
MTWRVVVKNGLAYVNDFNSGLYLVRMEPESVAKGRDLLHGDPNP